MKKTSTLLHLCTVFAIVSIVDTSMALPVRSCLSGRGFPLFSLMEKTRATREQKITMLENVCSELGRPGLHEKESIGERIRNKMAYVGGGLFGDAAAAFDDMNDSETQRAYMAALRKIKTIPDPMERIRRTYDLAVRHSGRYDEETLGLKTIKRGYLFGAHTPGNLVGSAKETGSIGVCREYAALLSWSLTQVARHTGSKRWDLGPTDFGVSSVPGQVPGGGHVWVRVRLPEHDRRGRLVGFVTFDLDTTWYGDFTPLFPRRTGMSETTRRRALDQCLEAIRCLGGDVYEPSIDAPTATTGR